MLSNFMYFLEYLHAVRSLFAVIALLLGVVFMLIWKFKKKKHLLFICAAALTAVSCAVLLHGCYSAYVRPQSMEVKLTQEELADFCESVLKDDRFLDLNGFLPNNQKDFYKEERNKKGYRADETVSYENTVQSVLYRPNSAVYYELSAFEDAQTAERVFRQAYLSDFDNSASAENKICLETDAYTAYARQDFHATFFDLHQGEHNVTDLTVSIVRENYIITLYESTESHTPKLYSLIKDKKLFDRDYTLKAWVE